MESKIFAGGLIVAIIIMAAVTYLQWQTVQVTAEMVVNLQKQVTACNAEMKKKEAAK